MNIETYWLNADRNSRLWVLRECGWNNRTASAASRKSWETLSPAMQSVLTRKAREGAF